MNDSIEPSLKFRCKTNIYQLSQLNLLRLHRASICSTNRTTRGHIFHLWSRGLSYVKSHVSCTSQFLCTQAKCQNFVLIVRLKFLLFLLGLKVCSWIENRWIEILYNIKMHLMSGPGSPCIHSLLRSATHSTL